MTDLARLKRDAQRFADGEPNVQHQESTVEQLDDLYKLAKGFGMYDAADWLRKTLTENV